MIPLTSTLRISNQHGFRISVPLFIVWLLLIPVALFLLPFFFVGCLFVRVNPFKAIALVWQVIAALKGTNIEVDEPGCYVSVRFC